MSNPMEGANMGKREPWQETLEKLGKITTARAEAKLRHPKFFGEDKKTEVVPQATAAENLERPEKILPGAAGHDFRQRKILGEDFE